MFNVKRKPIPARLPEPEEAPQEVRKEDEPPRCVPEIEIEDLSTPPLTPLSETGDVSTDEQSVDSVEEPTVEEACRDETCEDESSKNDAFDVEICEEESSRDDDCELETYGEEVSKEDNCDGEEVEVEECDDVISKDKECIIDQGSEENGSHEEAAKEEAANDETSNEEECNGEVSQDDAPTVEVGLPSAPTEEADTPSAPEEDPEEIYERRDLPYGRNRNGYKIYLVWVVFWIIALGGGFLSYYFNRHQEIIAARLSGGIREENLLLMPREKWDDSRGVLAKPSSYTAERVVVVQTDTEGCETVTTCTKLLNAMKRQEGMLKYNFLIATDGCIYESLGWQEPSPMYPGTRTMVVAFIGDYETVAPSAMQLSQLSALLEASEELEYLSGAFNIIGRKQTVQPSKLFAYMAAFEKWDKENSDTDEQYIEVEFEQLPIFGV